MTGRDLDRERSGQIEQPDFTPEEEAAMDRAWERTAADEEAQRRAAGKGEQKGKRE